MLFEHLSYVACVWVGEFTLWLMDDDGNEVDN